jgi:hypothetical protein
VTATPYASFITDVPEVDIPVEGIRGWLSQGRIIRRISSRSTRSARYRRTATGRHEASWLKVRGNWSSAVTRAAMGLGTPTSLPAGVEHPARFLSHFRAIDVFADAHRYAAK